MNALLSAAKNMTTAASRTIRPVTEARRDAPRPPEPPPKSPLSGGSPPPFQISAVVVLAILLVFHSAYQRRVSLHHVVLRRSRHAVLVGTVIDDRVHAGEIIERRRRRDFPFQSG